MTRAEFQNRLRDQKSSVNLWRTWRKVQTYDIKEMHREGERERMSERESVLPLLLL